jgi:peroxiredoxin
MSKTSTITKGTPFPKAPLQAGFPTPIIDTEEYMKGKKVIVIGLPGAFTPT